MFFSTTTFKRLITLASLLLFLPDIAFAAGPTISRFYSDASTAPGVHTIFATTDSTATACTLTILEGATFTMTKSAVTSFSILFTKSVTLAAGKHTFRLSCQNAAAEKQTKDLTVIIANTTPPTINQFYADTTPGPGNHTIYANTSGNTAYCTLALNEVGQGQMTRSTLSGATNVIFNKVVALSVGKHTLGLSCTTDAGISKTANLTVLITDPNPPTITSLTVDSTNAGQRLVTVEATDKEGPPSNVHCTVYVNGTSAGLATPLASNPARRTASVLISTGSQTVKATCVDDAGNSTSKQTTWNFANPNVPADLNEDGVTIYRIYPANTKASFNQVISAEVSDNAVSCKFKYNNNDGPNTADVAMQKSSTVPAAGKALFTVATFIAAGSNDATVQCYDQLSNGAVKYYAWTAAETAETTFGNQTYGLTVDSKNNGARTFTVLTSLNTKECALAIDQGTSVAMSKGTSNDSTKLAFIATVEIALGAHQAMVNCHDYYSNGASASLRWTAAFTPSVTVNAAGSGFAWTISASAPFCNESPAVVEKKCTVYVDGTNKGSMSETSADTGVFSTALTLTTGTHAVVVKCTNAAGVTASGSKQVTVSSPTTPNPALNPTINSVSRSGSNTEPFTITINATGGSSNVLTCGVLIDSQDGGEFDSVSSHTYEMSHVVVPAGSHTFNFVCYDDNYRYTTKQQTWSFTQVNSDTDKEDTAETDTSDTSDETGTSDGGDNEADDNEEEEVTYESDDEPADEQDDYTDDTSDDSESDEDAAPSQPAPRVSSGGGAQTTARPRTTVSTPRPTQTTAVAAKTTASANAVSSAAIAGWIAERISPVTRIGTSTPPTSSFRAHPAALPLSKAFSLFSFISEHKLAIGATLAALCTFVLAGVIMLVVIKKK